MLLSVCIVNWNTRDDLRECLAALFAFPPQNSDMEVLVVDNASRDGSAQMTAQEFPGAVLIANSENKGYAEGNNQALTRARGDCALLLNPDAIVHPDSLTRAMDFLRAHPEAGAVGCRLVGRDGETQQSVRGFPDPGPVLWEWLRLPRLLPRSRRVGAYRMAWFDYNKEAEVDQPMGSFLLIPRAALDQVGLLDPRFPLFFNEVDWCWRAKREHGRHIYYTPSAVVTHYGARSTSQVEPRKIKESHRSLLDFYDKHYRARLFPPLLWLIRQAVRWDERRQLRRLNQKQT